MKLYKHETKSIIRKMQNQDPFFDYLTAKIIPILKQKGSGRVLDLGSGSGRNSIVAAKMGFEVVAVEINNDVLEIARNIAKEEGITDRITFHHADILKLKTGQFGQFDIVILQEVIEHIDDYQKAIDFAYLCLKKDGILILSTPHDPAQWNILDEYAEHVRRFTVYEVLDGLSSFGSLQAYTVGFPLHRFILTTYSWFLQSQKKQHSAATFRKQRVISRLYYIVGSMFLRIDDLFNWTYRGTTIVAIATK